MSNTYGINKWSINQTIRLSAPLSGAQLVTFLFSFVDAATIGSYGIDAVSAAAVAISFLITIQLLGNGTITIVGIRISRYLSLLNHAAVKSTINAGFIFTAIYSVAAYVVVVGYILILNQQSILNSNALNFLTCYLLLAGLALPFSMLFIMFRSALTSIGDTRSTLLVSIFALILKGIINGATILLVTKAEHAAIFIGIGATLSNIVLCVGLYFRARKSRLNGYFKFSSNHSTEIAETKKMVLEGYPIGLTYAFEAAIYAIIAWGLGLVSDSALAIHYVVKQYVHFTFMLLTGLSQITAVRVSDAWARNDKLRAMSIGVESFGLTMVVVIIISIAYCVFSKTLILLILPKNMITPEILSLAGLVFAISIIMQIFDNAVNIASGVMRGMGLSREALLATVFGYYLVGLPLIYLLGDFFKLSVIGAWVGLSIALFVTFCIMLLQLFRKFFSSGFSLNSKSTTAT